MTMMDGLYEFRMLTPTAIRFGVLLKQGALLLGRAGDRVVVGIIGIGNNGAAADLMTWEYDKAGGPPTKLLNRPRAHLRGTMTRGGARLVADGGNGRDAELRVDLNLFRTPTSRACGGFR